MDRLSPQNEVFTATEPEAPNAFHQSEDQPEPQATPEQSQVYTEQLSPKDREIVDVAAGDLVQGYEQSLSEIANLIERYGQIPLRASSYAENQAQRVTTALAHADMENAAHIGQRRLSEETIAAIHAAVDARASLAQLEAGAQPLDVLQVHPDINLGRFLTPSQKRQRAQAALAQKLSTAQQMVMAEIGQPDQIQPTLIVGLASRAVSEDAVKYVAGERDELGVSEKIPTNERLQILLATGLLNEREVGAQLKTAIEQHLVESAGHYLATATKPLEAAELIYLDATLAGAQARDVVQAELEQALLSAYHDLCLAQGHTPERADAYTKDKQATWARRKHDSETRFAESVLPGDTMLEHYTPLSLDVVRNGGLLPQIEHGRTSTNWRSRQVHFTGTNANRREQGIDYAGYADLQAETKEALRNNPNLKLMSGVFTVSLGDIIQQGANLALFTTKHVEGVSQPEDIVLTSEAEDGRFGLETLQFVPREFSEKATSRRFPYDAAIEARLEQLRGSWRPSDGEWPQYIEQHLDELAIARDTLLAQGADPKWVESHVFPDLSAIQDGLRTKYGKRKIVPLAQAPHGTLAGETIDGDSSTIQCVYLGVA
jgi:hypothetical protein